MLTRTYDPLQDLDDIERDMRRLVRAANAVLRGARRAGDLLTDSLLAELRDAVDDADAWFTD